MITIRINSKCQTGTLKCDEDDNAIICDFLKGFAFNEQTNECTQKTVEGCQVLGFPGNSATCFICKDNHIYDELTGICVSIPENQKVENCKKYEVFENKYHCFSCESEFFFKDSRCVPVSENQIINNCSSYSIQNESSVLCLDCKNGFYLQNNICLEVQKLNNCLVHVDRKCTQCQDGYFMNKAKINVQEENSQNWFINLYLLEEKTISLNNFVTNSICFKKDIPNCEDYSSFGKCLKCQNEYFVNSFGKCESALGPKINNCKKYKNKNECSECEEGYFSNQSTNFLCQPHSPHDNCYFFDKFENQCELCNENYYLNKLSEKNCLLRNNQRILDCKEFDPLNDSCLKCDNDTFLTNDKLTCKAPPINCVEGEEIWGNTKQEEHQCGKCIESHFLSENKICSELRVKVTQLNQPKCLIFSNNSDQCERCEESFFLNIDKTECLEIKIDNCLIHSKSENICETCESLFYPNSDQTICLNISTKNCRESDGIKNKCLKCLPEYLFLDHECQNLRKAINFDKKCYSNIFSIDNTNCSECDLNHILFDISSYQYSLPKNCEVINPVTKKCQQCSPFYILDLLNNSCRLSEKKSENIICLQHLKNNEQELDIETDCEKCNFSNNYYKNEMNTCLKITSSKIWEGCIDKSENNSPCYECSENYSLVRMDQFSCSDFGKEFKPIEGCQIYQNSKKCLVCQLGYKMDPKIEGLCIKSQNSNLIAFTDDIFLYKYLKPQSDLLNRNFVANCKTFMAIGQSDIACVECEESFLPLVGYITNDLTGINSQKVPKFGSHKTDHSIFNSILKCINNESGFSHALTYNNEIKSNSIFQSVNDCEIGILPGSIQNSKSWCCIKCKNGFSGSYISHYSDIEEGGELKKLPCLKSCNPIPNSSQNNKLGIGHFSKNIFSSIQFNHLLQNVDCDFSNQFLFVHGKIKAFSTFGIEFASYSNLKPFQECEEIPESRKVLNCALYGYGEDVEIQSEKNLEFARCWVCEPGYKLIKSLNSKDLNSLDICENISNCLDHGNWYGACKNPEFGFKTLKEDPSNPPVFDPSNLPEKGIDNCILMNHSADKCYICETGFSINPTTFLCDNIKDLLPGCQDFGFGESNLSYAGSFKMIFLKNYFLIEKKIGNKTSSFCEKCASNKYPVIDFFKNGIYDETPSQISKCSISAPNQKKSDENVKGCKIANLEKDGSINSDFPCLICSKTSFKEKNGTCTEILNFDENCKKYLNSSICFECKSNYFLDESNKCVETSCETWTNSNKWDKSGECLLCPANYKLISFENNNLHHYSCQEKSEFEIENDECEIYSPSVYSCIKCKNNNFFPVLFTNNEENNSNLGWKCFEKELHHSSKYGNFIYFEFNIQTNSKLLKSLEILQKSDLQFEIKDLDIQERPPANICISNKNDENCKDGEMEMFCKKCKDGFYFDFMNFSCSPITIEGCVISLDNKECLSCEYKTHHLSQNSKTCLRRVKSSIDVCGSFQNLHLYKDECLKCDSSKKYFDSLKRICIEPSNSSNCKIFHQTKDSCQECFEGFWKNSVNPDHIICSPYIKATNCFDKENSRDPNKDQCLFCKESHWKQISNENIICREVTGGNCTSAEKNSDSCITCEKGFVQIIENNLFRCEKLISKIENCKEKGEETYEINTGLCHECNDGYYKSEEGKECLLNLTGIENCLEYKSKTECLKCKDQFFIHQNKCQPIINKIPNCLSYLNQNQCSKCENTHFLKNNQCEQITAKGCLTYIDEKTCNQCKNGYIKDSKEINCIDSNIENCFQAKKIENQIFCEKCKSGFYLDIIKKECIEAHPKIDNCINYENLEICLECKAPFMLSLDKRSCEDPKTSLGKNCFSGIFLKSPACDECNPGFKFDENFNCVSNNIEGCMTENLSGDSCIICSSGYYMNKELKCIKNIESQKLFVNLIVLIFVGLLI